MHGFVIKKKLIEVQKQKRTEQFGVEANHK